MECEINEYNLTFNDIEEHNIKVRAILIDENNKVLVANYGEVFLFPGGKVDPREKVSSAISRELKEELGRDYDSKDLDCFLILNHYQKDYPKRDGIFLNRLVQTYYFLGDYNGINEKTQKLTEKEQKDKFRLELVCVEDLKNIILNNKTNNPRNIFFQTEMLEVLNHYNKNSSLKPKVKICKNN